MSLKNFTIRLDEKVIESISKKAKANGITSGALGRIAVLKYLEHDLTDPVSKSMDERLLFLEKFFDEMTKPPYEKLQEVFSGFRFFTEKRAAAEKAERDAAEKAKGGNGVAS